MAPPNAPWDRSTTPGGLATSLDTILAVVLVALAALFVAFDLPGRAVFGGLLVLFLPGYALLLALYPASRQPTERDVGFRDGELALGERLLLAVGVSVTSMPLVGVVLGATGLGYDPLTFLLAYAPLTLCCLLVGERRRRRLPADRRWVLPLADWETRARRGLTGSSSRLDAALTVALSIAVLAAAAGLGYGLVAPADGESYTNFYLASENATGHLVASGYPTNLTRGAAANVTVGLDNHEQRRENYTIVVELQRVRVVGNQTVIERRATLARRNVTVDPGASWHDPVTFTPPFTGTNLRLTFFLYRGSAPKKPTGATAYRSLHLWVTVNN